MLFYNWFNSIGKYIPIGSQYFFIMGVIHLFKNKTIHAQLLTIHTLDATLLSVNCKICICKEAYSSCVYAITIRKLENTQHKQWHKPLYPFRYQFIESTFFTHVDTLARCKFFTKKITHGTYWEFWDKLNWDGSLDVQNSLSSVIYSHPKLHKRWISSGTINVFDGIMTSKIRTN